MFNSTKFYCYNYVKKYMVFYTLTVIFSYVSTKWLFQKISIPPMGEINNPPPTLGIRGCEIASCDNDVMSRDICVNLLARSWVCVGVTSGQFISIVFAWRKFEIHICILHKKSFQMISYDHGLSSILP